MPIAADGVPITIVLAPDSFKESLTAREVCDALERGLLRSLPDARITKVPMADGGEGTVQALVDATGGELRITTVTGPLGEPVEATWGVLGRWPDSEVTEPDPSGGKVLDGIAVIEMAAASGLGLVPEDRRDVRRATTYGVGELIRAAWDEDIRHIVLGIGGSATNDGGAGMAQALGLRLLDAEGNDLEPGGAALAYLDRIDASGLDPRVQSLVQVACDVTNPLCGPEGASAVYGPQKGAGSQVVAELDGALAHWAEVLDRDLGRSVAEVPGAGAAGGLGAGLLAVFGEHCLLRPGVDIVVDQTRLFERILGADLVITGEGRIDAQTRFGKTPMGVATMARHAGVPCIAVAGVLGDGADDLVGDMFEAAIPVVARLGGVDEALTAGAGNLERVGRTIGTLLALGHRMDGPMVG